MDLLIDGSHGEHSKTTIYGIYKVLELQEKFGLDAIARVAGVLNSCI